MNNSQQQQQTIQQSNPNAADNKLNQFKHGMQEFDGQQSKQAQGLNDLNIPQFDDKTQNLNQLLNQVPAMPGLDKLPGGNPLLASNLQGLTGQFNPGNFQAGLGNLDLSTLGSITGTLNLGMPNLPNNLLTDLSNLEGLTSGPNGQQLNGLAGMHGLPGQGQSIQSLQDNLLKNIQQNSVNFPFNPEKLDDKDKLSTVELLKQEIPQSDLNHLGSAFNQNQVDVLNQLKAPGTSGKNTPGQQTQNLQVNSGTTATTPGDHGAQQQDKQKFDVQKFLQDIQGMSDFNGGANSNNLQDVLKSLNGGQNPEQITKAQESAGSDGQDVTKGLNLNPLTDYDKLQGLLGNVKKLEEPEKANQLGMPYKSPVDQNRSQDQLGQLNIGEYQFNPQLQALQSLTSNLTPESSQFGGLNANLPWSNPGLQTNNILQQLNSLSNPLANNTGAIPGLTNINGLGFGLNMGGLNQFGNSGGNMPGGTGMPPQMRQNSGGNGVLIPGSQAHVYNFNLKGPDNEIKLFVGGLAYQTQEYDLIDYFKKYGTVVDAIVMRDRQTSRGRGFGFVKMRFENKDLAYENKMKLLSANFKNPTDGHKINGKLVDVKSADDYVKPMPGQQMQNNNVTTQLLAMSKEQQNATQSRNQAEQSKPNYGGMQPREGGKFNREEPNGMMNVTKPNPYVIVKQKDANGDAPGKGNDQKDTDENKQIVFEYPKSKIFVGGLDFKLTNDDLKQHFQQYGQIESAVILKDINTGQSRGFGFVTFKDEAVAQDLIQNVQNTNICGRKVDIKSAEPKQNNMNQPAPIIPRKMNHGGMYGGGQNMNGGNDRHNQYAMIPQYGGEQHNDQGSASGMRRGPNDEGGQEGYNDSQSSNNYQGRRGGGDSMHRRGGNDYYQRNDGYGYQPNSQNYSNGPDYDGIRQERERGRDNYRDQRGPKRYRDDRDRMDRGQRDRDRRNMGPEYDDERRERRMDRDRGRRRGHYQYSRSDSMDSSKSSSSYNNQHRRSREDRRGRNQQRERRGPHHGGGNHGSPSRNEKETQ